MRKVCALLSILAMMALLVACHSPKPTPLPAEDILQRATARMKNLSSFHFVIDRRGAPAFLDDKQTISFRRAEGDFVFPDRARATVRVITPGLVAEIRMVSTGDSYWETDLLSGKWMSLPVEMGFNPAILFDPYTGFQPILQTELTALELVGAEELDTLPGQLNYHLAGTLGGNRLYDLSYGMIGPEQVSVELWIAPASFEINRILITEAGVDGGEATYWQIDFWNFNSQFEIQPPVLPSVTPSF